MSPGNSLRVENVGPRVSVFKVLMSVASLEFSDVGKSLRTVTIGTDQAIALLAWGQDCQLPGPGTVCSTSAKTFLLRSQLFWTCLTVSHVHLHMYSPIECEQL